MGARQLGNQGGHADQQKWTPDKIRSVLRGEAACSGDGIVGGRGQVGREQNLDSTGKYSGLTDCYAAWPHGHILNEGCKPRWRKQTCRSNNLGSGNRGQTLQVHRRIFFPLA